MAAVSADAATDVILYATDAGIVRGNWSPAADSTAAGGVILTSTDRGWSSPDAALAAPSDYFEFTFSAPAATPYRVWLRLRAAASSKFNDSVFVQFSDAVNAQGAAVHRIGTTSALTGNLQSCNGCALSGWGWIDGAYWLAQSSVVSFTTTGSHTLRVQTREDGVQLDEIVLSPATFLSSSPGQVINDSTMIRKPAAPPVGTSTPFAGAPAAIPGTIQAAAFDNGGEGVAYHDGTRGNTGGAYRQTDVDLEPSTDGGYDVGWIGAGEWLNYTVTVANAGAYTATFRVASLGQGGTFHVEVNGTNVSGAVAVPNTGGWQTWQSVTKTITLAAGAQILRVVMDTAGVGGGIGNLTSMSFAAAGGASVTTPYTGTPVSIPGTVQAENFDNGGEGVAYHDTTAGNSGGMLRSTDVDVEPASSGGYDVGWVMPGEWLNYSVDVTTAGTYTVNVRVASSGQGGTFHIEMNGVNVTGSLSVPNTGGWQNWQTVSKTVSLTGGRQVARLVMDSMNAAVGNFDAIQFVAGTPAPTPTGSTINVPAGGDLQAAIDTAQPGDTIVLAAGAVYRGSFILRLKGGSSYITIRSSAADATLPADGVRVTPANVGQLATVQGGVAGMPAFTTEPGAHHYRLLFLQLVNSYANNQVVQIGDSGTLQDTLSEVPHHITIDRCYIHGDPVNGQKRGILLEGAFTTVTNSYISDIKSAFSESQAISSANSPGPFTITNNYLEATGENIMFGGDDPSIVNLVPSDITIAGNTIRKQPAWRNQGYTVKNLIEFKNAQRVVVDNNLIEYCWAAAQLGYAFMITPASQNGGAPWSVVQHLQITNNVVRHVASVADLVGVAANTSIVTNDVVFRNNLFLDVSKANWGGSGVMLASNGGRNVVFDHNTLFTDGTSVVFADENPTAGFVFTNNIVPDNAWAIMGSNASPGNGTLAMYFPGAIVSGNVFVAGSAGAYPAGNYFPATVSAVGFANIAGGDYRLLSTSPYAKGATDGGPVGYSGPIVQ